MFKKFNFLKYYGTKISIFQWGIKTFGPKCSYFIFEVVNFWGFWGPAKSRGDKKIKSRSFHQYSWNSEVETIWISLISWHHKTSNKLVQGTIKICKKHFHNLILWNYYYGRTPHSHSHRHCGILGLHPFADGHFGLLSHDLLMLFFESLILLPLLVFQCRLLILKDNKFNRKVTSKCKGKKISEANWGLKKSWVK